MNRTPLIFSLTWLLVCASAFPATPENPTLQIGAIYYFGYAGLDLSKVQQHLPIQIGESVHLDDPVWAAIRSAVQQITGKPPTDIARVCCDKSNHLLIYIGLNGTSSHPLPTKTAPHGSVHLEEAASKLYEQAMNAMADAVQRGASGEDDSKGYTISEDPATRQIDLAVRAYAAQRGPELERVLRNSADAQQRRVSAWLLGYANRSPAQIQGLTEAANDADAETRNNAVRALWVLASQQNVPPLKIDPAPFIALLFSGQWSDRNKGSLLLEKFTRSRDPALLDELRNRALPPLLEGTKWAPGHANVFLVILGRIANLPAGRIDKLIQEGKASQIIQAVEHASQAHR